jgi:hypothetical protein
MLFKRIQKYNGLFARSVSIYTLYTILCVSFLVYSATCSGRSLLGTGTLITLDHPKAQVSYTDSKLQLNSDTTTSAIALHVLWYEVTPHKARGVLPCLVRQSTTHLRTLTQI